MRFVLLLIAALSFILLSATSNAAPRSHRGDSWDLQWGRLEVSANNRYLQHENGNPFLWIGDTAWELFHRLDRDEVEEYLDDRRAKGFTIIQATLIAEMDGFNTPNAYGHFPFHGRDVTRPRAVRGRKNDYWDHVDFVLDEARDRGIAIALLPTWGEWVSPRFVEEPYIKSVRDAYRYGNFLGKRFQKNKSIVWVLGGDRKPTEGDHARMVWKGMAEGIADGVNGKNYPDGRADYSSTLMSYHSMTTSAQWWAEDPWIDFYMWGTYHSTKDWPRSFQIARQDWNRANPKPTLNAEPCYEEMPRDYKGNNGFFGATEVRNAAYWSVLSGSFGFTYGAHPIWQMWDGIPPVSTVKLPALAPTRMTWREALSLPGSQQMYHLRRLLLTRKFEQLRPEDSLLVNPPDPEDPDVGAQILAARGDQFALFYSPHGRPIEVRVDQFSEDGVKAWWFDPREGMFIEIGEFPSTERLALDPPGEGPDNDWVLLVDDAKSQLPLPRNK